MAGWRGLPTRPGGTTTSEPAYANGEGHATTWFDRVPYPTAAPDVWVDVPKTEGQLWPRGDW